MGLLRILALVMALFIGAAHAQAKEDVEVGGWTIFENAQGCAALATYTHPTDGQSLFAFAFRPETGDVEISFTFNKATSVKMFQQVKLDIFFWSPSKVVDGWGEIEFTAVTNEQDASRFFVSEGLSKNMLDDLAANIAIAMFYNGKRVTGFDLSGTAKAVTELRKCAYEKVGLHPEDPFLK